MKFLYEYRTSDNVQHDGVIDAVDREAAFAALKAQGIRPGRMVEAPGFFNKLFGKGKRWIAIGVLALSTLVLSVALWLSRLGDGVQTPVQTADRQQIYGDPGVLEEMRANDFASVFTNLDERCLARYAQPGDKVDMGAANPDEISVVPVAIAEDDIAEIAMLKRIVNGMKAEYAAYRAAGGTAQSYCRRLAKRQREEAEIFARYEAELSRETSREVWTRRNAELRAQGLPMVQYVKKDRMQEGDEIKNKISH